MKGRVWSRTGAMALAAALAAGTGLWAGGVLAASPPPPSPPLTYADLADLADSTPLVLLAEIRGFAPLAPDPARSVRAGWVRVYIEARPLGALRGAMPQVPLLRYLADVPLDARGKLPALKKAQVLLFARKGEAGAGDIQLVAPDGQLYREPVLEGRVAAVLAQMAEPDAPGAIVGVAEALNEPGTLAGEGETQIFLTMQNGEPASISVVHKPGQPVRWGVSFSEVVSTNARPPARDSLAWYRLACFLPQDLPPSANVAEAAQNREQALVDYRLVRNGLGKCERNRF